MLQHLSYRLKRLNRAFLARLALVSPRLDAMGARAPLLKLEYAAARRNTNLIVFLPGIDDLAEDFERHGFIHDLQRARLAVDAVAVDAHFGYYTKRIILDRLTDDVIDAAHDAGYRNIWLIGISLGGFGAAAYTAHHSHRVRGVLLLAPYLGDDALIAEIEAAGGLHAWEPGQVADKDFPRQVWRWFKQHLAAPETGPELHLGYGTGDTFARAHALLSQALPHERVQAIPGRHDWRTWRVLWRAFLETRR